MHMSSIATPTSMQSAVQRRPSILRCHHRHLAVVAHAQTSYELRVCTNRTCKRQGSPTVLKLAKDLALEQLTVNECGCLGSCGAGPNVALLPQGMLLHHVSTPADLAEVLSSQCGLSISQELLKATELRLAGNAEAMSGNLQQAEQLYTQALELDVTAGRHLLLSNRSAVRLQQGNQQGALRDAQEAVEAAPADFTKAWVRLIDAHYALGQYRQAADMVAEATARCAGFKQAPEYKQIPVNAVMPQAIEAAVTKAVGKSSKVAA